MMENRQTEEVRNSQCSNIFPYFLTWYLDMAIMHVDTIKKYIAFK